MKAGLSIPAAARAVLFALSPAVWNIGTKPTSVRFCRIPVK